MYPITYFFVNLLTLFYFSRSENQVSNELFDTACKNIPAGYNVVDVVSLLISNKLPEGIVREKLPSEYEVYHIDRSLPQYRKMALCLNGHADLLDTPEVNILVHKRLGDAHYIAHVDKVPLHLREYDDNCKLVQGYVHYEGQFDYSVPADKIVKIGTISVMHKPACDRLHEMSYIPCQALVDPVNGHFPKHSVITPYNQDADIIDLGNGLMEDHVLVCGPDHQHHFRLREFSKVFRYEYQGYKYAAVGEIRKDNLLLPAICKYGGKEPPSLKKPQDKEFVGALSTLIPSDINIPGLVDVFTGKTHDHVSHLISHGITYKKLDEYVHEFTIDRFVVRTPLLLMDSFALSVAADPSLNIVWIIIPNEAEAVKFKYQVVLGGLGSGRYREELNIEFAYTCDLNSKVHHVSSLNFGIGESPKTIAAPIIQYYSVLPKRPVRYVPFVNGADLSDMDELRKQYGYTEPMAAQPIAVGA